MFHNFFYRLFYPSYYKTEINPPEPYTNEKLEQLSKDMKKLVSNISEVREDLSFIKKELKNKNIYNILYKEE